MSTPLKNHLHAFLQFSALLLALALFTVGTVPAFAATRNTQKAPNIRMQYTPHDQTDGCSDSTPDLAHWGTIFLQSCLPSSAFLSHASARLSLTNHTPFVTITHWSTCTLTLNVFAVDQDPTLQTPVFSHPFTCLPQAQQGTYQSSYTDLSLDFIPTFLHSYVAQAQLSYTYTPLDPGPDASQHLTATSPPTLLEF